MTTTKRARFIPVGTAVLCLLVSASAQAGLGLGISQPGSPHNFSLETWNPTAEICRVCHVPHDHQRAERRYLNGLSWNHRVSSASYTMYSSGWSSTLDGAQSAQPDGTAKLCLSCHDGTVAIDTFDRYAGGSWYMADENTNLVIPGFADGTDRDLRGTHPISIAYDTAADTKLHSTAATMGTSGTIASVLDNGKVQCSSCHDVHDQESVAGTRLLRVAQSAAEGGNASGLCLTCHIK